MHSEHSNIAGRNKFLSLLNDEFEKCRREQRSLGLLLVDLQRFSAINTAFGYGAGDQLLSNFASRLAHIGRHTDTVGRLGNDEFALMMPGIINGAHASLAANKLLDSLEEPFVIDGRPYKVSISMGIAVYPEHAATPGSLVRNAEFALAQSRTSNIPYQLYNSAEPSEDTSSIVVESELCDAIKHGELSMHFQPKINLLTGVMCGAEALARWRHPERGMIRPDFFIPIAERTHHIGPLTMWSLNTTLRECSEWLGKGRDLSVAVNLSANVLNEPDVVALVEHALRFWGVEPQHLIMEVTESAMMQNPTHCLETLRMLSDIGVVLSIDDFGTGYSSLAYLKRLPVQELKIDKSFVMNMAMNSNDSMIVKSIIDLAHNFGLKVTAEGVEDHATMELLTGLGCDQAQGYYIAHPMPRDDLELWLEKSDFRPV